MSISATTSAQPVSGPRLPERYLLRRRIATGGMATVWCAEDRLLGRSVAVKVLSERYAGDPLAVRRFKREARAAARVSAHPHVVTIFDVGDLELDETEVAEAERRATPPLGASAAPAFIVMEYLAGGTVADAIRVGAVGLPDTVRWLGQAASALDHAHERGVVHRDIKPANFLLDNARGLHVADFGIARLQSEDTITSTGEMFGTAAYLAPEQALGRDATSATDRYSLGVTAFELLAGERPFTATGFAAQARQHVDEPPPAASERNRSLPPEVDQVLIRALAKDPEERYETATAFVAALEAALDTAPPTALTRPLPRRAVVAVPRAPTDSARPRSRPPGSRAPARERRPATGPLVRRPGHRGRLGALAALAVAALGVALVGLLGRSAPVAQRAAAVSHGGRGHRRSSRHHVHRARTRTSASSSTTAADVPAAGSQVSSSSATTPAGGSAADLQARGHQDLTAGDYAAAIAADRQALAAANPSSLTYAYALYDLGVGLMRSGDPQAAIPVLEQRLRIPDQTGVVQATLEQAQRQAGAGAPAPAAAPGPAAHPPGHGRGSGGTGLPPGQAKKNGGGD